MKIKVAAEPLAKHLEARQRYHDRAAAALVKKRGKPPRGYHEHSEIARFFGALVAVMHHRVDDGV